MNAKNKNKIYWDILTNQYQINLNEKFGDLKWPEIGTLTKLTKAFNIKSRKGKTPEKTLFERAKEGRPF